MKNTTRLLFYIMMFWGFSSQIYGNNFSHPDIKRILGCWNDVDNQSWEYGFFEKFAIYHSDFWEYQSIKLDKNKAEVVLRKGTERVNLKLLFDKKTDSICTIVSSEKGKRKMVRHTVQPEYTTKDHRTFVDKGYQLDSVTIMGYLRNTQRSKPFSVSISKLFSNERDIFYADIDSLGRFQMTVPVVNITSAYLDLEKGGLCLPGIFEPQDTLLLYYDYNREDIRFMGKNARLNHEIVHYFQYPPHRNWQDTRSFNAKMDHETYLEKHKESYKEINGIFDKYISMHPFVSEIFKQYTRMDMLTQHATSLIQRRFKLRRNFNKEFFGSAYMEYITQLYLQIKQPVTLCGADYFISNYLDYYNGMDACPVTSAQMETILYLNEEKRYPLSSQQLEDLKAHEWSMAIATMGEYAKADSLTIDSLANPYKEGMLRANKILEDTTLLRLVKEHAYLFNELVEIKQIKDDFYCFNYVQVTPTIKEWKIAQTFYERLENTKTALSERSILLFQSLVSNEYFRKVIQEKQEMYKAIAKQKMGYTESLKKTDHLKESKDADKLLKELIAPYKGKIIYLDVWGTWCGPCKKEMTYLPAVKEAMAGKDVVFMYLANNSPEESWKNVIKENKLTGSNVVHYNLPNEQQQLLERRLSVRYYPTYIIIDKEGTILDIHPPRPSETENLIKKLEELLAK